jgi:adenine-specific DNA methylase
MSKWWARRPSSVFRALLISAATKAPYEPSESAATVWKSFYGNFEKKKNFAKIRVADIFMGGGTTLIEGARLGFDIQGADLNPVAWFVVQNSFKRTDPGAISALLSDIEADVKPQIMPFIACDGPNGEKGVWTHKQTGRRMGEEFDPLTLSFMERKDYVYEGPEIIYTFWSKHGPCQTTGCGHRTPIMTTPVMAVKVLSVKCWEHKCSSCGGRFDIEETEARMAPDVPLFVAPDETPYSKLDSKGRATCPKCGHIDMVRLGKGKNKKVELSLLVHPEWLAGSPKDDVNGYPFGGAPQDGAASSAEWNAERAKHIRLLEVRGKLPESVTCPETGVSFSTGKEGGTVPKRSTFTCAACGSMQDLSTATRESKKGGQIAGYAIHGMAPKRAASNASYNGRFFAKFDAKLAKQYDAASAEWELRKDQDLSEFWPRSELPYGFMTAVANGDIRKNYSFTHWSTMFNPRQLLILSILLKSIVSVQSRDGRLHEQSTREFVLGSFLRYLQHQNMFCFWDIQQDCVAPSLANANFHPKANLVENSVFADLGRGNWKSSVSTLFESIEWHNRPWDLVSNQRLEQINPSLQGQLSGKSEKVFIGDDIKSIPHANCTSSTDMPQTESGSVDLIITDPPFGGLLHYSELSDFFYVWLRLALRNHYPAIFDAELTPKALEVVSNRAREPDDADGFYQRLLTQCWREANRVLKPGGILAFTFHHSEDAPWVSVLESLFDAGFYLEATYPIRSDETKGEGSKPGTFGSQQIEYDIIHVCRKRMDEPKAISWARMRREVLSDVRQLQGMLENHAKAGLPAADLQVIRRGKALEYFSRHYGKVYVDEGRPISVKDALVGINQLIDEDANATAEPPPVIAEPISRQFLRIFDGKTELARDQIQKLLRGSGIAPNEFESRGWCSEDKKVFRFVDPLAFARDWQGKHRRRLTADLDQALVMIGACYDGSGINASDTLKNENFKPHPALKSLLEWLTKRGSGQPMRNAASRALSIYNGWAENNRDAVKQLSLFQEE